MALRFAKTAWIKLFSWPNKLYRRVEYGSSAEIQKLDHIG